MSDDNRIVQAAQFLLEEHRTRKPLAQFQPRAARTVDEAYAVQEALHALMAATHGPVAGYKIALTTPVMQQMVGFHEPVSGAILAQTMQQSPCTIRSTDYGRLGVECEIAVRLEADLPVTSAPYSRDHITAIGAVMAAFELIDDRNADYAQFAPQIFPLLLTTPGMAVSFSGRQPQIGGLLTSRRYMARWSSTMPSLVRGMAGMSWAIRLTPSYGLLTARAWQEALPVWSL